MPDSVRDRFPLSEERRTHETRVALLAGQVPKATTRDLGPQGVWLRTADGREIAQFRLDGFTFSRLNPYTSWEDILPKALEVWTLYSKLLEPEVVTRVAVRYINHIPLAEGPVDLDRLIVTGPRTPEGVPDVLGQFSSRILLAHPELKLHATVTQSLEPGVLSANPTLLLDIDAFKLGDFEVASAALIPHLEALRVYKNQIFFGSLTDDFAKTFE